MHPNSSQRRVYGAEFKAQILAECRHPGASVAAVSIGHGINPNVVRKWLAGRDLKRTGTAAVASATVAHSPQLQFVPVPLPASAGCDAGSQKAAVDVRIELHRGALQVQLRCPSNEGAHYASVLRALADVIGG